MIEPAIIIAIIKACIEIAVLYKKYNSKIKKLNYIYNIMEDQTLPQSKSKSKSTSTKRKKFNPLKKDIINDDSKDVKNIETKTNINTMPIQTDTSNNIDTKPIDIIPIQTEEYDKKKAIKKVNPLLKHRSKINM